MESVLKSFHGLTFRVLMRAMRCGVSTKIFLLLAALSIVTIGAMGVASRISFNNGFLGYLNEQGYARLETLTPAFAKAYAQHGSWDFVRGNPNAWVNLLGSALQWPELNVDNARLVPSLPSELEFTGLNLRLTLLDADKSVIMGHLGVTPDAPMRPIMVDGKTVGWLALVPFQQATAQADVRFQRQYLTTILIVGICIVVLAAFAAWWLARLLVTPLRRIANATHRLSGGDYNVRIPVTSRDEIGRLSQDFNQLAQALAHNEQLRRSFMADVSHELRTPLAVLKGELEAIEDGVRKTTPAALASLQSEVETLNKLVNDLYDLSLSDVGALSYRMTEVGIGDLLQVTLAAFGQRFSERGLRVDARISSSIIVRGDEGGLQQLFNNLLENSGRYIEQGGTLRISCDAIDSDVVIELEDSGPGVPPDILPHLFERFFRVEASRNRAHGGAGLGLAICRNIVEAHSGTITATQAQLGGLLIRVRLPIESLERAA
jgi:two-component system sensor histidine kinase BaeS